MILQPKHNEGVEAAKMRTAAELLAKQGQFK
jgi:hypothetical protein